MTLLNNNLNRKISFEQAHNEFLNQPIYQSKNLIEGKIIQISNTNIYFDIGLKVPAVVNKKAFVSTFLKIESILKGSKIKKSSVHHLLSKIKTGQKYKFMIYELKNIKNNIFVDLHKTLEYVQYNKMFYEFDYIRRTEGVLKGYVLNTVNGGFSIGFKGLVGFAPNNEFLTKPFKSLSKFGNFFKGNFLNFKILNINFEKHNIVLQRVLTKDKTEEK